MTPLYDEVYLDGISLCFYDRFISGYISLSNVSWRSLIFGYARSMTLQDALRSIWRKSFGYKKDAA